VTWVHWLLLGFLALVFIITTCRKALGRVLQAGADARNRWPEELRRIERESWQMEREAAHREHGKAQLPTQPSYRSLG